MLSTYKNQLISDIVATARGFSDAGRYCLKYLTEDEENRPGYLPAATANICFSLELLLKAIYTLDNEFKSGHDLLKLWKSIPNGRRKTIEMMFVNSRPKPHTYFGAGHIFIKTYKNESVEIDPLKIARSLEEVFEMHRENFIKFRYIFEAIEVKKQYHFEGEVLVDLIDILFNYLENELKKNGNYF